MSIENNKKLLIFDLMDKRKRIEPNRLKKKKKRKWEKKGNNK